MKIYRDRQKLNYFSAACNLKRLIPELKDMSAEDIEYHLKGSNIVFHKENVKHVTLLRRLTLPFAILTLIIGFIFMPIAFMITGKWGYDKNWIYNWFKSLNLH